MEVLFGALAVLGIAVLLMVFVLFRIFFWPSEDDNTYEDDRFWGFQDVDDRVKRKAKVK